MRRAGPSLSDRAGVYQTRNTPRGEIYLINAGLAWSAFAALFTGLGLVYLAAILTSSFGFSHASPVLRQAIEPICVRRSTAPPC